MTVREAIQTLKQIEAEFGDIDLVTALHHPGVFSIYKGLDFQVIDLSEDVDKPRLMCAFMELLEPAPERHLKVVK